MKFPNRKNWIKKVANPTDGYALDAITENGKYGLYEYYKNKRDICERFKPKSIFEVGVRWGYSSFAFLSTGVVEKYIGMDWVMGEHGGAINQNTLPWAESMLRRNFKDIDFQFIDVDSQTVNEFPNVEMIHVDANHSYNGCLHDVEVSWESIDSGIILVDDYKSTQSVKDAVDYFIKKTNAKSEYIDSRRGELIIFK